MSKGNETAILQRNLKHLRTKRGLSIQEMAKTLGLSNRGTYYAWERGKSQPNISMLLKLAHEFDISVDELLSMDLSKVAENSASTQTEGTYEVEIVPYKAAAGYSASYSDPDWQEENLRKIQIPFKPPIGEVRAFPVSGDSMEPKVSEGAFIVAVKLQDPRNEAIQGKDYIIVTRDRGIMYKILFWKDNGAQLISLNHAKQGPIDIEGDDIVQVWKFFCVMEMRKGE